MTTTSFEAFFREIAALETPPYPYQSSLALDPWPDLLDVPTGLGKTAAIGISWLWKRGNHDESTPRRLVYCLPMRTLVEQTARLMSQWCERSSAYFGGRPPRVHVLMGGANDEWAADPENEWFRHPERDAILVGTQDMLLSRALMRGYAMSLYAWPIHFAFLHSDALWVFDEVQLMGPAIATTAQLEGLRRKFPIAGAPTRSLWCSATLSKSWLATYDMREEIDSFQTLSIASEDRQIASQRLNARKSVQRAATVLSKENSKGGAVNYAKELASEVLARHRAGTRTLVIINQVERAQALYREVRKRKPGSEVLLLHSRFRRPDRAEIERRLRSATEDQIVIATQVIEAGVDLSSAVLFTELPPWDAFVQRCGRCNRAGEFDDAEILWIDLDSSEEGQRLPYEENDLSRARDLIRSLTSADSETLRIVRANHGDAPRPAGKVLRRRDLLDLFSTDSDLSGFHIDVSEFIRDSDERTVYVFWREFNEGAAPNEQAQPARDELCASSIVQIRQALKTRTGWKWDPLAPAHDGSGDGRWVRVGERDVYPGLTLMLRASAGGYDRDLGFDSRSESAVEPIPPNDKSRTEGIGTDRGVYATGTWLELDRHLVQSDEYARELCAALSLSPAETLAVATAAVWHDIGKLHPVFQEDLLRHLSLDDERRQKPWAKSPRRRANGADDSDGAERHPRRRFFRHELVSALAVLEHLGRDDADLIAYLVAAHHGKVRTRLRALPDEPAPFDPSARFVRGVWEGDRIPPFAADGMLSIPETTIRLDVMEIGSGEAGRSWTARVRDLLEEHGPFRLAWLESLVRMADWRASAAAEMDGPKEAQ